MSTARTIFKNVLSNWVGYAINAIVSFFIAPFIVHSLGNTGYGIWTLSASIVGYLGILDFGIRPAIVKYVSHYHTLKDPDNLNAVMSTVFYVFCGLGLIVLALTGVVAFFANSLFEVPELKQGVFQIVVLIVGVNLAISFPFGVFEAVLAALQRFEIRNAIQIANLLLRTVVVVIVLNNGGEVIALAVIALCSSFVGFIAKAIACYKALPSLHIKWDLKSRATLKTILSFSVYAFLMGISMRISFQTDSIVIGAFLSASAITFFAVGANLVEYLTGIVSQVTTTITPVASALNARNAIDKMQILLITGSKYLLLIILPVGTTFIILGDVFISLWMGTEYREPSSAVLTILTISYFGYLTHFMAASILYGLGRLKVITILTVAAAIVNIVLSIILVGPYGINGVAWGTTIPQLLLSTIFYPVYISHVVRIGVLEYLRKSLAPPILTAAIFVGGLYLLREYVTYSNLAQFFLHIALLLIPYFAVAAFTCLEAEHREAAIRYSRKGLRLLLRR